MFTNRPFKRTVKDLQTFEDIMNYSRWTKEGIPDYANLELEAFKLAQNAFIKTYEAVVLCRYQKEYEDKATDTIEDNKKILKELYSEIKDVQHDDEGYPFVKTGPPDSDSGLSSDSDSSGKDEEIPMPTKKRIIRRKPKN
tara:strand:- start:9 stop:428 length:420 start_codon:yes stop_codon:yes gene_type:complete